jgi:hypothetical protein
VAAPKFRPKIAVDLAPLLATADAMPSATAALLKWSGAFSLRSRRFGPSRFQNGQMFTLAQSPASMWRMKLSVHVGYLDPTWSVAFGVCFTKRAEQPLR